MKNIIKALAKVTLPAILLVCASTTSHASSVNIVGYENAQPSPIIGVWSTTNKVTFSSTGTYSMSLSDFGLESSLSKSASTPFSYLGAVVSSSNGNTLGSITFNGTKERDQLSTFNVNEGADYWLTILAITDSKDNTGLFNMNLVPGSVSPVPLPASFWFMATSLLGLFSFFRQNRAAKNLAAA